MLDAALSVATDPDAGDWLRKAAEAAYHRIASNVDPVNNTIAFNALKTERSTFGAIVDNMFQPSSGARNAKDTVARNIAPIEDAMSASMQQAANDPSGACLDAARPGLEGAQSGQTQPGGHRRRADDVNAPQPWEKYATSDDITGNLRGAVPGGDLPTLTSSAA